VFVTLLLRLKEGVRIDGRRTRQAHRPIVLVHCNPSLIGYIIKGQPPPLFRVCGVSLQLSHIFVVDFNIIDQASSGRLVRVQGTPLGPEFDSRWERIFGLEGKKSPRLPPIPKACSRSRPVLIGLL
jgi:hypothetical protein